MSSLSVTDYKFADLLSQAFFNVHNVLLQILKEALESSLIQLRDQVIGSTAYHRGMRYKRWGYTIRKWIQTPIGVLERVRIPRVRSAHNEIRLFIDRFCRRSSEMEEILMEGYLWGMSSRRLSLLMKRIFKDSLSASSICKLKETVREKIESYRSRTINADIIGLVVDGVWIKFRNGGKGVILAALCITAQGQVVFLDWQVSDSESISAWLRLFRALLSRGMKIPEVIISDDTPGIKQAMAYAFGSEVKHQLCLWHVSQDMKRHLENRQQWNVRYFMRDYWEVFEALSKKELEKRLEQFVERWQEKEPEAINIFLSKKQNIIVYYDYDVKWRHRMRTTNLAEGFFKHLRTFIRRYPGWIDERQIDLTFGLYLLGMNAYKHNKNHREASISITNANFNRIF
jgi:transposase-like protein